MFTLLEPCTAFPFTRDVAMYGLSLLAFSQDPGRKRKQKQRYLSAHQVIRQLAQVDSWHLPMLCTM